MRAPTPLDQLQFLGDHVEMPTPTHPVGTRLNIQALDEATQKYYFRKAAKEIIRDTRKIVMKLKRDGYMKAMTSKKMLEYNKAQIRAKLDMMRFADVVEIAGHRPQGMHVTGTVGSQCYLVNGQCHSGVGYEHFLLFRRTDDGCKLVYIHPYAIIGGCLKDLAIPTAPATPAI